MKGPNPFYSEAHIAFRHTIDRFVKNEITPYVNEWDEAGAFPLELHKKAAALGIMGNGFDEAYGGLGQIDALLHVVIHQSLARCGCGGLVASLLTHYIGAPPIQALGSAEMKARVLPGILSGDKISALGITEPSGGSDVANLKTTARRDGDYFVVNGSKTFITSGMRADYYVIAVRTGGEGMHGISLLLVEKGMPGFDQTPLKKMGWWCSDTATLYFDNCLVPAQNLLGPENEGFRAIMHNFNIERLSLIALATEYARVCLEAAIDYARERTTFGKRLADHQVIRHKIVDMAQRINATQAWLELLAWQINQGHVPVAELSQAKVQATTTMEFCAREALQIFGGAGYIRGNVVERLYREVRVMAIGGGSEEIMRDLASRQMRL